MIKMCSAQIESTSLKVSIVDNGNILSVSVFVLLENEEWDENGIYSIKYSFDFFFFNKMIVVNERCSFFSFAS